MSSEKNDKKNSYTILGIGDPGKYVIENIEAGLGDKVILSLNVFERSSDFRMEDIDCSEHTKALFLLLQPGDGAIDTFISALESFSDKTGIPVYTIANYPFLWEGHVRINKAKDLLDDLIRISSATFRIESHQWFPLKEQLGFHRVAELVHKVALRALVSILELQEQGTDISTKECISIGENLVAKQQQEGLWLVSRANLDFKDSVDRLRS